MVHITIAYASKYHTTTLKVALTGHRIVVSFFTQKSIGGMNKKMTWNLKGIPYMTSDTQTGFSEVPFGFGSARVDLDQGIFFNSTIFYILYKEFGSMCPYQCSNPWIWCFK